MSERLQFAYDGSTSESMEQISRQDQRFTFISRMMKTLVQNNGMEVFKNIEGLKEYTGEIVEDILQNPDDTFVVGFMGRPSSGKEGAGGGMLFALDRILNSSYAQTLLRKSGAGKRRVELLYMSLASTMDQLDTEGIFTVGTNKRHPGHFAYASQTMSEGIDWAINSRAKRDDGEEDDKILRVVICESVGMGDFNPEERGAVPYNERLGFHPPFRKIDWGGSTLKRLAQEYPHFRLIGINGDEKVWENGKIVRRAAESGDPEELKAALEKTGTSLDENQTPEDFAKGGATAEGTVISHATININLAHLGKELLAKTDGVETMVDFDYKLLENTPELRRLIDKQHMARLIQEWGAQGMIGENNFLETRRMHLKQKIAYHRFPWENVPMRPHTDVVSRRPL